MRLCRSWGHWSVSWKDSTKSFPWGLKVQKTRTVKDFFFVSSHAQQTWSGRPGVVLLCPLRRWRSRFSCVAAVSCCRRLCRHGGCRCYCGWGGGCPPGWERLTRARCWQWCQERGGPGPEGVDSVKHVEKESLNLQGDVRATFRGIKIICRWRVDTHFWLFFVSYLHTDNTSPTTAVLAFINCLIATAQGIESQYSSHAVPNEAYLERKRVRRKVNKTNHPSSSPSKTHMQLLQDSSAVETRWICS